MKIRYHDFETVSRQEVIDYTALDDVLIAKVKSLFNKLYRKGHKVRLLGVRFSHLIPFNIQMNLFDQSEEKLQLYKAVDKIKNQFGYDVITKGSTIPKKDNKA